MEELYTLSVDLQDAGEYMPHSLVSESAFRDEFTQTGFWADNSGKLIIEETQTGKIVGEIGCFKAARYLDGREVYYRIFSGNRGKGYASEALQLFIRLFFDVTSMNRIQAVTVDGNAESEHILEKIGFKREGQLRQARWLRGTIVNLNMFSLLRRELHGKV